MQCEGCGAENRAGRRFCGQCGHELAVTCAACGAANDPGDRFCGACGRALAAAAPAAPLAERRMVSVLFADLVGFTALSESRDPEEVRELLARYFESARAIIARHGGAVEKFIGDAVMAVWGAPTAQEDDAERAARTALELVDAVRALGEEAGHPLEARAAIASGEAAVTVGATGQGMVAGDLVNTASRMQSVAAPGSVMVDEASRRMIAGAIACEPAGSFELKGKREPMPLWRAARVAAARRGFGRAEGLDPPFVGRERELRLLKDLFHATADGGRAHLVSVTGIAGIGKSRLSWEFEKYLDGLADEVLWHRGRCLSYGEGVAFWALAEMVRMRARIAEDEPADTAEAKLAAVVAEWVPDPADRAWVTPPLRHLLGLEQVADGDRERLYPAWRRFFEAMSERLPVVLVVEDMQWADESLLTFVEYLMEWSRDHRLFVIALARPEMMERRPGWGAASRALTSLALEPLTTRAMVELVSGMVPGLSADAVDRIVAAAEGVPLYAVETVRMLLDRGLVERTPGGGFRAAGAIAQIEIPETLHALVAARLDSLPDDDRRLLQQAAVLGKSFTLDGLAAISGRERDQVEPALAALARRELVAVQSDPRSPERGQYAFVQDIVRTIARDTLGRRERKRVHLAAADHLAELGGEELAEVIAAHQLDAYRLIPDDADAGELCERARAGLLRASERAASLAAPAEALRLVLQALELGEDDAGRAALHERAGRLALQTGDVSAAEREFTAAIDLYGQRDPHAAARVRARRGDVRFLQGRADQGVAEMEEAYAVLSSQAPDADLAQLAAQLGRLATMIGESEGGSEPLERAIDIAEELGLPDVLSDALNTKGLWTYMHLGHREEGRSLLLGALRVALDGDAPEAAMRAYFNLAFERDGMDDLSHDYDDRGLALAERTGNTQWRRSFQIHLGVTAMEGGDWDGSLRIAQEIEESPGARADFFSRSALLVPRAVILARRGEVDAALEAIASSGIDASAPDVQSRATLYAARAETLAAQSRFAEAADVARSGGELTAVLGIRHPAVKMAFIAQTHSALRAGDGATAAAGLARLDALPAGSISPRLNAHRALLRAMLGDPADAEWLFAVAVAHAREVGNPWQLAVTLAEQAAAGVDRPAALAEAADVLARLGAAAALERLVPGLAGEPAATAARS